MSVDDLLPEFCQLRTSTGAVPTRSLAALATSTMVLMPGHSSMLLGGVSTPMDDGCCFGQSPVVIGSDVGVGRVHDLHFDL